MKFSTRFLSQAAVIAAVYAVLTVMLMPLSYGNVQMRVSEALTVLPVFTPAAVPGLFVGCVIANFFSPNSTLYDMILGSGATLVAALLTWWVGRMIPDRATLRAKRLLAILAPLPPVLVNGVVIGAMLWYLYEMPLVLTMLSVAAGELVACYVLGVPLMLAFERIFKKTGMFFEPSAKNVVK